MKALPLFIVLTALSCATQPVNAAQVRNFCDIAILPYDVGKNLSFVYTFTTFQTETVSFSVTLTCGTYINVLVYNRPSTSVTLYLRDTVTLPGGFLPSRTASIKLTATGTGFTVLKTLNLTARSYGVVEPVFLSDDSYTATGKTATVTSNGTIVYYSEVLQFRGFLGQYEANAYHRLNLPDLSFSYQNGWTYVIPSRLEAEFYLEDPYAVFPNLPYDSTFQARHLNGQFLKTADGYYHFSITDPLYVDPSTLMMSILSGPGYTSTSFVYFPKNHFSELQSTIGRILVAPFGFNSLTVDFYFYHDAVYPFFGSCASAAYCVVVGNDAFDLGYDYTYEETTHA